MQKCDIEVRKKKSVVYFGNDPFRKYFCFFYLLCHWGRRWLIAQLILVENFGIWMVFGILYNLEHFLEDPLKPWSPKWNKSQSPIFGNPLKYSKPLRLWSVEKQLKFKALVGSFDKSQYLSLFLWLKDNTPPYNSGLPIGKSVCICQHLDYDLKIFKKFRLDCSEENLLITFFAVR